MKKGLLSFHQGWSDIINCLPLINYYAEKYDRLLVVSRGYTSHILDFYVRDKQNVNILYTPTDDTDTIVADLAKTNQYDLLLHGFHDTNRNDNYQNIFHQKYFSAQPDIGAENVHFVKLFYELYNIPYKTRIEKFEFKRDLDLEEETYKKIIDSYSEPYVVKHNGKENEKIHFPINENITCIDLDGCVNNIFSAIKILQNASEMFLVDSLWATFCYMLDCKYELFKNTPIKLYPYRQRSGGCIPRPNILTLEPQHPSNWTVVEQ